MAECGFGDVSCGVGNAVSGIVDDAIGNLAKSILEGTSQMVTTLSTFWVAMPTVNLATGDGVTPSPVVGFVNSGLGSWTLTLAVLSVILGGTRMIWEQRGAPLKDLLRSLLTLTLVSGLGLAVISILVIAADAFSVSIIDRATDGKGFAEAMSVLVMMNQTGTGVFILIILGLVGLIASLVQIVLMIVRTGMLVILAGILPTTAAFTNTEMGRQWFQKAVGWTIAFILYKPAAAIVYAVAFQLMGSAASGGNVLLGPITGFALMIVALLALPALMRFVTPMVGAVASGAGERSRCGGRGRGHRRRLDGTLRQRTRQRIPHPGQPARPARCQRRRQQGRRRQQRRHRQTHPWLNRPRRGPGQGHHNKRRNSRRGRHRPGQEQPPAVQALPRVRRRLQARLAWPSPLEYKQRPGFPGPHNRPRRIRPGMIQHRRAPVAAISTDYKEPSYGNWRVPRSAGLGNLGAIGTGIVMAGLLAGITTFALLGLVPGLGVLAVAGASALLLTVKDKHGQSVVDRFGTRMSFRLSRSSGTNLYRSGPLGCDGVGHVPAPRPGREVPAV